jgi:hypothetical protein
MRMHQRMQTTRAKRLMKQRQSTAEPVIGTLVNYLGIKRVNTKGLAQANKCVTMAAVAYNLKKLIKHASTRIVTNVQALKKQGKQVNPILLNVLSALPPVFCNTSVPTAHVNFLKLKSHLKT